MKKMTYTFKKLALVFSAGAVLVACGGDQASGDLQTLRTKKDSLKEVKNLVAKELGELEVQIKLADTSGNTKLPLVTTSTIELSDFNHYFQVQGFVETDQNALLNADASGKIRSINVDEGDHVKKGQLLIQLDNRVIENNIAEVESQIELAKTVYEKQKSLWDQQIGSEIQYLETKQNYESLQHRLETMKSQRDLYAIKAPFDGIVDELFPKVGEMATPMAPMVRVLNMNQVYIKADVSERYLGQIKVGDVAIISFQEMGKSFPSSITRIGNFINPDNRSFKVRFDFKNDIAEIKPNLLAKIDITDYTKKGAIVIPTKYVQENPNGEEFIYVLAKSDVPSVEKRMITTGKSYKGEVEIVEGLSAGEKIILQGGRSVKDGDLVEVTQ